MEYVNDHTKSDIRKKCAFFNMIFHIYGERKNVVCALD